MSHNQFLYLLKKKCKELGKPALHGHSFRIGNTLEPLLCCVLFAVVKTKGCWRSKTFQDYLQDHKHILALYLQAIPEQEAEFAQQTALGAPPK
jgi:hypothetical protein